MHAATTAMNALMYGWMGLTAEDIQLDSTKPTKGLFMAVGWNTSPAHALIYAMSKYCATHSNKGYSVGQNTWATSSTSRAAWHELMERQRRRASTASN